MIRIVFILFGSNENWTETCQAVPRVGEAVQVGGKLRSVRRVRWVKHDLGYLVPEILVD